MSNETWSGVGFLVILLCSVLGNLALIFLEVTWSLDVL